MKEWIKTTLGVLCGIIGVGIVLTPFFFSEQTKVERSLVDPDTHCPVAKAKSVWGIHKVHPPMEGGRTAVLVDATDRIPALHRELIGNWFRRDFTESLARFERVAIYEVRPHTHTAMPMLNAPLFDKCAPPVQANIWIENPRKVREKFETQFMATMLHVVRLLASKEEAQWSPIVEMVGHLFEEKKYDQLILISDLMQNTPDCSMYRRPSSCQESAACRPFSQRALQDKRLRVLFLKRQKISSLQDGSVFSFWEQCIDGKGGIFSVENLPEPWPPIH